jgi:PIN domain nuclease of toxin-antitoxin system
VADLVLDTHTCAFALTAPEKLGRAARRALEEVAAGRQTAWIPAAVVAEIILLRELGRISLGLAQLETAMERAPSLRFLPLDLYQLREFAAHATVRDPFDRFILSATRARAAKLVTRDRALGDSGLVQTIWA